MADGQQPLRPSRDGSFLPSIASPKGFGRASFDSDQTGGKAPTTNLLATSSAECCFCWSIPPRVDQSFETGNSGQNSENVPKLVERAKKKSN